jgi:hypothetical protein
MSLEAEHRSWEHMMLAQARNSHAVVTCPTQGDQPSANFRSVSIDGRRSVAENATSDGRPGIRRSLDSEDLLVLSPLSQKYPIRLSSLLTFPQCRYAPLVESVVGFC